MRVCSCLSFIIHNWNTIDISWASEDELNLFSSFLKFDINNMHEATWCPNEASKASAINKEIACIFYSSLHDFIWSEQPLCERGRGGVIIFTFFFFKKYSNIDLQSLMNFPRFPSLMCQTWGWKPGLWFSICSLQYNMAFAQGSQVNTEP